MRQRNSNLFFRYAEGMRTNNVTKCRNSVLINLEIVLLQCYQWITSTFISIRTNPTLLGEHIPAEYCVFTVIEKLTKLDCS